MQRKLITAGALILASIPLVASTANALSGASGPVRSVDPIAEVSDRLEELYGPNTRPLRNDTVQATDALLGRMGNLSSATETLFTAIDDMEAAHASEPWDLLRQGTYDNLNIDAATFPAVKADVDHIFNADEATTPPIPQWALDCYSVASGSSAAATQGGLTPYKPVLWYLKWLYKQHKKAKAYKKLCAKRYQSYENYWRKHCEDQGCTFRVTGSGDMFCFHCDCNEPDPDDPAPVESAFGLMTSQGSTPWKSNPGDFASPFGKCLGKNALCGAN